VTARAQSLHEEEDLHLAAREPGLGVDVQDRERSVSHAAAQGTGPPPAAPGRRTSYPLGVRRARKSPVWKLGTIAGIVLAAAGVLCLVAGVLATLSVTTERRDAGERGSGAFARLDPNAWLGTGMLLAPAGGLVLLAGLLGRKRERDRERLEQQDREPWR
jgi:hypothetical protein